MRSATMLSATMLPATGRAGRTAGGRRGLPTYRGLFLSVVAAWSLVSALTLWRLVVAHHHEAPGGAGARAGWWPVLADLAYWQAMTVTMMVPALAPLLRHLVTHTLRRRRAVWLFLTGYLAVWAGFGLVWIGAVTALRGWPAGAAWLTHHGGWSTVVVLAAAAGWQLTRAKQAQLRGCRAGRVLPAHGVRADFGALAFGVRRAGACVGACWAMMLAMVLGMLTAPTGHLIWMVVFLAVIWAEQAQARGRELARPTAATFVVLAAAQAVLL